MSRPTDSAKHQFDQADTFIAKAGLKLRAARPLPGEEARHSPTVIRCVAAVWEASRLAILQSRPRARFA
jgi:hypothetical protein